MRRPMTARLSNHFKIKVMLGKNKIFVSSLNVLLNMRVCPSLGVTACKEKK